MAEADRKRETEEDARNTFVVRVYLEEKKRAMADPTFEDLAARIGTITSAVCGRAQAEIDRLNAQIAELKARVDEYERREKFDRDVARSKESAGARSPKVK